MSIVDFMKFYWQNSYGQIPLQRIIWNLEQNYNFACGFVWVCNLVADIEGGTQAEGVEESIWT